MGSAWPGLPSRATVIQALQRAARTRSDHALKRRAHIWLERRGLPDAPPESLTRPPPTAGPPRRPPAPRAPSSPGTVTPPSKRDGTHRYERTPRSSRCRHRPAGGHSRTGHGGPRAGSAAGSRPALWSRTESTSPARTSTPAIRSSCTSTTVRSPRSGPIEAAASPSPSRSSFRQVLSRQSRRSATVAVGSLAPERNAGSCYWN